MTSKKSSGQARALFLLVSVEFLPTFSCYTFSMKRLAQKQAAKVKVLGGSIYMRTKEKIAQQEKFLRSMEENERKLNDSAQVIIDSKTAERLICSSKEGSSDQLIAFVKGKASLLDVDYRNDFVSECKQIHCNVRVGDVSSIEIHMDKLTHHYMGSHLPLGQTCIRLCVAEEETEPLFIFLLEEKPLPVRVFLGGKNSCAFLAVSDEDGAEYVVPLMQFHMLSVSENSQPGREVGLVTSFIKGTLGGVYSTPILANDLTAIKSLILADWLAVTLKKTATKGAEQQDSEKGRVTPDGK